MYTLLRRALRRFGSVHSSRRRDGKGFAWSAPAVESLEDRVLLSAGDDLWPDSIIPPAPDFSAEDDRFNDVAVQADGKVVAVGVVREFGNDDFLVARFTADGRLDKSFNGKGWKAIDLGETWDETANAVAIQADGKILVGGTTTPASGGTRMGLVRLDRDGGTDGSFGSKGIKMISLPNGRNLRLNALALTSGGRILAAGASSENVATHGKVYELTSAGVPDGGFNGNGSRLLDGGEVYAMVVDSLGRVVMSGSGAAVTRLTAAGALDGNFAGDGTMSVNVFDSTLSLRGLGIDVANRIVVAGTGSDGGVMRPFVVRLLGDGNPDSAFGFHSTSSFKVNGIIPAADVRDLGLLPDGSIVVAGNFISTSGTYVAVLNVLGGTAAFGDEGVASGRIETLRGVAVLKDGNYVVAGYDDDTDDRSQIDAIQGRYPRRNDLLGWTGGFWFTAVSTGTAFDTRSFGNWNPNANWQLIDTADFNGDGVADVAGRDGTGQWWVGLNNGAGFLTSRWGRWNEAAGWRDVRFADFDGDGRADIAGRTNTGQWWVSVSTGGGFRTGAFWDQWAEAAAWRDVIAADYNGDGRADLAGRASNGEWWVDVSTGARFAKARWDVWNEAAQWRDVRVGDFDGDGRTDIAGRTSYGEWWVGASTGSRFVKSRWGLWSALVPWNDVLVGDIDGDGRDDIFGRVSNGDWFVADSTGGGFQNVKLTTWNEGARWRDVRLGDLDGDGRADLAGRAFNGEWYVTRFDGFKVSTALWGTWNEAAGWRTFKQDEFAPA